MSASGLIEQLAQLREAAAELRARERGSVVDALAAVYEAWSAPHSHWRDELVRLLPDATGFHRETVRAASDAGFAEYTGPALRELVDSELEEIEADGRTRGSGGDVTAVFLAGAIPMPTLVAATAPLLLRSCAWIRPSSRDPVTPQLVADSVAAIDAQLARCIGFASFHPEDTECIEAFLRADSIVVTGSDTTVSAVAKRCRPGVVPIPYGHRLSIAIAGAEATRGDALAAAAEGLARDVAFWDQLGCLSPTAVWIVDPDPRASRSFGEALAAALARAQRKWPRGAVDVSAAAALRAERTTAAMRAGVDVLVGAADAWTVVCEDAPTPRPTPLHRFVRVHPCGGGTRELAAALAPLRGQVTAVAGAGWGADRDAYLDLCARLGASRICPPGRLQTPPLTWHHDNRGVLTPLIRWCDVELR